MSSGLSVLAGLCGLALLGLAFVAYKKVSPTVGGEFFDSHPRAKRFQQLFGPIWCALLGLALVVVALVR